MRLIDLDEALEAMNELGLSAVEDADWDSLENYQIARTALEELRVKDMEPFEWIPVEKREPESSGEYMVTYQGLLGTKVKPMLYGKKIGWWRYNNEKVLAWAEIPKPYQKSKSSSMDFTAH